MVRLQFENFKSGQKLAGWVRVGKLAEAVRLFKELTLSTCRLYKSSPVAIKFSDELSVLVWCSTNEYITFHQDEIFSIPENLEYYFYLNVCTLYFECILYIRYFMVCTVSYDLYNKTQFNGI